MYGVGFGIKKGIFLVNRMTTIIQKKLSEGASNVPCFEWNSLVPLKINIFVWHLLNGGIALRPNMIKRGVRMPTELCVMCN